MVDEVQNRAICKLSNRPTLSFFISLSHQCNNINIFISISEAKIRLLNELHGTSYQGPSDVDISTASDTSEVLNSTDKERKTDEDIEEVQNNQYGNREGETEEITVNGKTTPPSTSGELDLAYIAISNSDLIEEAINSKATIELFDSSG
jgi:hypothetical protein